MAVENTSAHGFFLLSRRRRASPAGIACANAWTFADIRAGPADLNRRAAIARVASMNLLMISRARYYELKQLGLAPVEMFVGRRRLISFEAAERWRRQREAAA